MKDRKNVTVIIYINIKVSVMDLIERFSLYSDQHKIFEIKDVR